MKFTQLEASKLLDKIDELVSSDSPHDDVVLYGLCLAVTMADDFPTTGMAKERVVPFVRRYIQTNVVSPLKKPSNEENL